MSAFLIIVLQISPFETELATGKETSGQVKLEAVYKCIYVREKGNQQVLSTRFRPATGGEGPQEGQ